MSIILIYFHMNSQNNVSISTAPVTNIVSSCLHVLFYIFIFLPVCPITNHDCHRITAMAHVRYVNCIRAVFFFCSDDNFHFSIYSRTVEIFLMDKRKTQETRRTRRKCIKLFEWNIR